MNNMHYILHCIHTSHNFTVSSFCVVKDLSDLHILLLFINIFILHHLQSYLSPQLRPCFLFIRIILLKLQYMYFTFVHFISNTFDIDIELELNQCTYNKEGFVTLLPSKGVRHGLNPSLIIFFWLLK